MGFLHPLDYATCPNMKWGRSIRPTRTPAASPWAVLTRDVLLNVTWGYDYYGTTRTVDVYIRGLKLKIPILNDAIISVKSLGDTLSDHLPVK